MADVTHQMHALAEERGLELRVASPDEPLYITADDRAVRQILLNLLSNAIKFTPDGTVTITTSVEGDTALLEVRDTGPGIPEEHREGIFEEFVQLGHAQSERDGTGLGLSIVRRLAQLHGGEVAVEGTSGGGYRFVVRLPVAGPDPAATRIRRNGTGAH